MKADSNSVEKFLDAMLKEIRDMRLEIAKLRERVDAFSPEEKSFIARMLKRFKRGD